MMLLFLGVVGVLLIVWGVRGGTQKQQPTGNASSEYVDAAVCASCHREIAATYKKTGMARSFYRPTTKNVVEDYTGTHTVSHQASGLQYRMEERDGRFFQRRSEAGFDGQEGNVREEQVDYVIGSGNHARTYLHRSATGHLIEMPVSWYTERSGSWAMSPGYDRKGQEDFRRAITPECLFCHNGYPEIDATAAQGKDATIFPEKLPEGIDCQRCHGPGRAHVEAARSRGATAEAVRAAIVNPARLTRDRQMEVCMQCHLETSSRHLPNEVRAYDREIFSYRPGQPLGDYKMYFDRISEGPADRPFEIVHAAVGLRRSACFLKSQMTCITCHNPHNIPRGEEATRQYTQVCQSCHQGVTHTVALPVGETCLSCHMPKRRTEDAVHVVMTDHFIQRVRPARDLLEPLPEVVDPPAPRGAKLAIYYPADPPKTARTELYLAVARVTETTAPQTALQQLRAMLERLKPAEGEPYLELARAYARGGRHMEAVPWFREAMSHGTRPRQATQGLVLSLLALRNDAEAIRVLRAALADDPNDAPLLTNLGNTLLRQSSVAEAKDVLSRALAIDPEVAETQNLMGLVSLAEGDRTATEKSFREAIRLQTDDEEAQNNLGTLLTGNHAFPEAAYHFEQAIAIEPGSASAHHGYGLMLILTGAYPQATTELREAVRLDPKGAQAFGDLGDVLAAQGQTESAAAAYREVLRLRPGQQDAQLGLGMALLRQGRAAEAHGYLEGARGGSDAALSQAATEALAQMPR